MDAHKLRNASPLKLSRWLDAARSRLGWHDCGEPEFHDARPWARQARAAERLKMVAEIQELEAETARRAALRSPPGS